MDERTSISPLRTPWPYTSSTGSMRMLGQIQSPRGIFARTSTRPYFIEVEFFVESRADMIGGTTAPVLAFETAEQTV
jgi:hypothetical protein